MKTSHSPIAPRSLNKRPDERNQHIHTHSEKKMKWDVYNSEGRKKNKKKKTETKWKREKKKRSAGIWKRTCGSSRLARLGTRRRRKIWIYHSHTSTLPHPPQKFLLFLPFFFFLFSVPYFCGLFVTSTISPTISSPAPSFPLYTHTHTSTTTNYIYLNIFLLLLPFLFLSLPQP